MKIIPKWLVSLAAVLGLAAVSAPATMFDYSYVFGDGLVVSGTLEGDVNGGYVENVANVTLQFNDVAVAGVFGPGYYDGSAFVDGPAVVSFDVFSSNFIFRNADDSVGFYIVNGAVFSADLATAYAFTDDLFVVSAEQPAPGIIGWSLKAAAVPDGGATGLMVLLAVVAVAAWRPRRSAGAIS